MINDKWQKEKVAYLQVRLLVFRASELGHNLKKLVQKRTPAALGHAGLTGRAVLWSS